MKKGWLWIVFFLFVLFIISFIFAGIMAIFIGEDYEVVDGNTAVIAVTGFISPTSAGMFGTEVATADDVIALIDKADKDDQIKAIVLKINSGGGAAVASEEIARAVKGVNKTTVAWIRDVGASGAYWIASSTDHIVANPMSVTGSIGVIGSYIGYSGLLERFNMTYERYVAGKYKDIGSPLKEPTNTERQMIQSHLNEIHDYFLASVKENRKLENDEAFREGQFFSGFKAKELGLVDELGGLSEVVIYLEKELNTTVELVEFKRKSSFLDLLSGVANEKSFYVGQGIGSALVDERRMANSYVVMT